jgi:hypothetical protein
MAGARVARDLSKGNGLNAELLSQLLDAPQDRQHPIVGVSQAETTPAQQFGQE